MLHYIISYKPEQPAAGHPEQPLPEQRRDDLGALLGDL